MKTKKKITPPQDLDLSDRRFKLLLSVYDYPYDKGSGARFLMSGSLKRGEEVDTEELEDFEPGVKMTCEFKNWICGLNSKKMEELAKWATQAAKYLKQEEKRAGDYDIDDGDFRE